MTCKRCYGRGKLFMGPDAVLVICPDCKGSGVVPDEDDEQIIAATEASESDD